eukprot:s3829_g2.t1
MLEVRQEAGETWPAGPVRHPGQETWPAGLIRNRGQKIASREEKRPEAAGGACWKCGKKRERRGPQARFVIQGKRRGPQARFVMQGKSVARRPGPAVRALLFGCGESAVFEPQCLEDRQFSCRALLFERGEGWEPSSGCFLFLGVLGSVFTAFPALAAALAAVLKAAAFFGEAFAFAFTLAMAFLGYTPFFLLLSLLEQNIGKYAY